eukprot:1443699-Rhodomonas_salina.1
MGRECERWEHSRASTGRYSLPAIAYACPYGARNVRCICLRVCYAVSSMVLRTGVVLCSATSYACAMPSPVASYACASTEAVGFGATDPLCYV